mgnify:CR=1 FL=1|tara:strand:+ start:100 stop:363 length:264 start_codon:yes stop_codon:yes gene_type:complete
MTKELNMKLLTVMRDEALLCEMRGDREDAAKLMEQVLNHIMSDLAEETKTNPKAIDVLISASNSDDEVKSTNALIILQYLKNKGLIK